MKNYSISRTGSLTGLIGYVLITLFFFAFVIGNIVSLLLFYATGSLGGESIFGVAGVYSFVIVLPVIGWLIYAWYKKYRLIKDRKQQITELANANGYTLSETALSQLDLKTSPVSAFETSANFKSTSIAMLAEEQGDIRVDNKIFKDDWAYGDYSFNFYRRSKNGKYKAGKIHYAVVSFTLPRRLPHVLFDSVTSNKKQFRMIFDGSQKHSLEGNFDTYFTTYFATDYTIDSMSFITPEVMQAMIEASAYDVEVVDDKLYLFGPIQHPAVQIPELIRLGSEIKKKLLNNILTYRDQRLDIVTGRQGVAAQGMRLKRSKWPAIISAASIALYVIFYVIDIIFD